MSDISEWEEKFNEKHQKKYWKNKTTGESVWKDPNKKSSSSSKAKQDVETASVAGSVAGSVAVASGEWEWEEKFNEKHKRKYWKHKTSGEVVWKEPPKPAAAAPAATANDNVDESIAVSEVATSAAPSVSIPSSTAEVVPQPTAVAALAHRRLCSLVNWDRSVVTTALTAVGDLSNSVLEPSSFARLEVTAHASGANANAAMEIKIECVDTALAPRVDGSRLLQRVTIKVAQITKVVAYPVSEVSFSVDPILF